VSLLLDSNAVLYWLMRPEELSDAARAHLRKASIIYISVATIWELEIKRAAGKLILSSDFWDVLAVGEVTVLPIEPPDAFRAATLPLHHRDPFDRMIVGQALGRDLSLITRDRALAAYGVRLIAT
jgi:PIN domain nuclease of toxin-antitoxin system